MRNVVLVRRALDHGGVVTRREALQLGVSDEVVASLVRSGTFRRRARGVLVLAGTPDGALTGIRVAMAAVGREALASHRSAAWLAGLIDRPPGAVHLTVPTAHGRHLPGVTTHRARTAPRRRFFQGVACTDVPRTLVDIACDTAPDALAMAVDRALCGGLVRVADLDAELLLPRRGVAALRRCLIERGDLGRPDATVLEAQMARLFVRSGLPLPRCEVHAGPGGRYRIDYAYSHCRLAIELNGFTTHHSPEQMAGDLARQRLLVLQGWTVLVYSWREVIYAGDRVIAEIAAAYRSCCAR